MRTNKLLLAVMALFLAFSGSVYSQLLTNSNIREDIEIWKPLDNPISISPDPDDPWGQITMPFAFVYDNTNISFINAYGNGFISLNKAYSPDGNSLPRFPQDNMIISWYRRNLFTTGTFTYQVTGTAPFRVLTVQQLGARVVTDLSGKVFDVQVKFYETTNEVKIIYNKYTGIGGAGVDGYLYFAGNYSGINARYINIKPNNPLQPSTYYYSTVNPNVTPFLTSNIVKYFYSGRSFTLTSVPKLSGIYPENNTLLASGNLYSGDQHPSVRVSRSLDQKDITIRYTITGPLGTPDSKVIYTAINQADINSSEKVDPDPQPAGTAIKVKMPHSKGLAGSLSDGALNLTNIPDFPSGEYRVDATLEYLDGTPYTHSISSKFTITFPSDIALLDIIEPVDNLGSIYPVEGVDVPVKILVKNQGANPVSNFVGSYKVYNASGTVVSQFAEEFDLSGNPIPFDGTRELYFSQKFNPQDTGTFHIVAEVNFGNPTQDKYLANNVFPRPGDPNKNFKVAYIVEAQFFSMLPAAISTYKNKPIRIGGKLKNNGVSNITQTWASVIITDPDGIVVKNDTMVVEEIPSGFINTSDIIWPEPFIPYKSGNYSVSFYVFAEEDEVPSNNLYNTVINVDAGLKGTYTISQNSGNFTTITEAVNALYNKGVDGPVTFLLSDPIFNEGNVLSNAPALDFSTKIIGSGAANPITFTVNPLIANRGAVQINLYSASGIGVYFGQSQIPGNTFAAILNVTDGMLKNYANNDGYITFDGGVKKALSFTIGTNNSFRSVFYLGNGTHHISVKNCLIEDGILQSPSYACRIPLTVYNQPFDRYDYEENSNLGGTFSAGITIRNTVPIVKSLGINLFGLDTLTSNNNNITGNEISKFGYGVVSLGLGSLNNVGKQAYINYYNKNNKINNNIISMVSRAGIYLGFEESSEVIGNRVYNVNGVCGADNAGIILGGDTRAGYFGYNNIGVQVSGNEISAVKGSNNLYGIKVEQSSAKIITPDGVYLFPDKDENIRLVNNIIWGFEPESAYANMIGLALFTTRKNNNNWTAMEFEQADKTYSSRNDIISNNTVFMMNDTYTNTGVIFATAILNTTGAQLLNNALTIDDNNIDANNPATAAVFYYGIHPSLNGIHTDRNAYWVTNTNAAIYRFIELDAQGRIAEIGSRREFVTLDQWQQWTKQDWNSVYGDFTKDYIRTGLAPFVFRINTNPLPLGSLLNNRGSATDLNQIDIDGKLRGEAGERYDIGAVEFKGRLQSRDLETRVMPKPGAYKATAPAPFSDADYIMTTSPVGVNSIVRNNGLLIATSINATLRIMRETPAGDFVQEGPVVYGPIEDLLFSEDKTIDFLTDDGINSGDNYEFFPKTYGQLRNDGYTIPDRFKAMEANVTPLYKFVIEVPTDNYNANNKVEKVVRFYIRKSPVRLMVSAADIPTSPISDLSPLNTIASKLNLDTLVAGFKRLGWYVNLELEDPRIDIDIFDRKQWEPRSINYPIYRSLFWVDGDDNVAGTPYRLTRYDRDNVTNFLASGTISSKKNLVVASQDIAKNHYPTYPDWVTNVLSVKPKTTPTSPLGDAVAYNGEYLKGLLVGKEKQFLVRATDFVGDALPYPATNTVNNSGKGITEPGMTYAKFLGDLPGINYYVPTAERIACFPTTYVDYNVIYTGVEWRHLGNIDDFLRGTLDYLTYYEGYVVPVNLISFEANAVANRVELNWETASEQNSDRFVVEKSQLNETGKTNFEAIETVLSAGNSTIINHYGPIIDNRVSANNTYIYRLKIYDKNGEFKFSDEKVVTLDGTYGDVTINEISPNPVNDKANFVVNSTKAHNATISLVDINGNLVMNIYNGNIQAGANSFAINANKLANGVYTVVVSVEGTILTTKLNVVK
ncbi:MAG TPA: T9SS type A sorting domain-containing protein [Candidatus Kapabacteria bacterium]|nr:T9SS type A sorting domain-containing protein [Candidatus Kapabacteria bacterium]